MKNRPSGCWAIVPLTAKESWKRWWQWKCWWQYNESHCQYIWTYIYVMYVHLSIFTPCFWIKLGCVVNRTWWFHLFRLNKVKFGEEKTRVMKFTQKICHQLVRLPFLPPFLGIIADLTHLVYGVAKKFCSNISIYKIRFL